jgi:two-component system LytT family response regulator
MNISCVAVDDEPIALEKIEGFIRKVHFLELKKAFTSPMDAYEYLKSNKVDLLFLDIQMEDLTGIQLLGLLSNKPKIIFTTAYDQYALKGYELDVSDYLLKPYSFDRFLIAVNKIHDQLSCSQARVEYSEAPMPSSSGSVPDQDDYIFLKTEFRMQKIYLRDILYIEGMKDYLRFVTPHQKIMTLQSFKKVEELLPNDRFVRVHKSFVVAIDKIESVEKNHINMANTCIPIGDNFRKNFLLLLGRKGLS